MIGANMPAYLVSYSALRARTDDDLDEFLDVLGAVPLADGLWGLTIGLKLEPLREWLSGQLETEDSMVVIELRPRLGQKNQNLSGEAADWLNQALVTNDK